MQFLRFKNFAISVLVLTCLMSLLPGLALAKESIDFTQLDLYSSANQESGESEFAYEIDNGSRVADVLKIENTSSFPVEVTLFASDAKISNEKEFILKDKSDLQEGLGLWTTFSEDSFELQPRTSREIAFDIAVPANADIGLHEGGIVVQRHTKTSEGLGLKLRKGVNVTVEVPGEIIKSAEFDLHEFRDLNDFNRLVYLFKNTGTVSLDASLELKVSPLIGGDKIYRKNLAIPRGDSRFAEFDWDKPFGGYYKATASLVDNLTNEVYATSTEENFVFVPWVEILLVMLLIFGFIFRRELREFLYKNFKKSLIDHLLVVVFVVGFLTYFQYRFPVDPGYLSASTIEISDRELSEEERAATYYLVAKWGHLIDRVESEELYMDSDVILSGATMEIYKSYSLEESDELILRNADRVVNIDSQIDDDHDGMALKITTDKNKAFNVAFEDKVRNLVHVYSIAELSEGVIVSAKRGTPYTFGDAELKLLRTDEELDSYLESSGLKEASGSAGVLLSSAAASPNVSAGQQLNKEDTIAVLKDILYEEAATPNSESSVSLNSDFVEEIVKSDIAAEVLASEEFISDLLATPKVLSLLAATAQSNVVFLPSETIVFPKQEFSFEERKIASTAIGTMVFINKKDKAWNAYISASDFNILAGNAEISASNLSVVPGPIIPINNTQIDLEEVKRGEKRRFEDENDQAILVTSDAEKDGMFIMRPRLELILGPSTRAGVYQGELTITYIDRR